MALNKEFWLTEIQNEIFADNMFYSFAVDHSQYVTNKTVHVPNVNTQITVLTDDTSTFPALAQTRTDTELTYNMSEFKTLPFTVKNVDEAEFSYDKKRSILDQMNGALIDAVSNKTIYNWSYNLPAASKIKTSGAGRAGYLSFQTGSRSGVTFNDFVNAMQVLDSQNVPVSGRKILISSGLLADVRKYLVASAIYAEPIVTKIVNDGSIGTIVGADVYIRSGNQVYFNPSGSTLEVTTSTGATFSDFILIWHPQFVSKAYGTKANAGIQLFEATSPLHWGDIWSALVRSGSSRLRSDNKGVAIIYEATA